MSAASWIAANKEWLFSGVGASAVAGLVALLKHGSSKKRAESPAYDDPLIEQVFLMPRQDASSSIFWGWRLLDRIPGLRLLARRKIYSEEEIARRLRVWIRGEGDGISYWKNGDAGTVRAWVDIVNLNPFPIVIDRITGDATVASSSVAKVNVIDQHTIPALSWKDVYLESELGAAQVASVDFQLKNQPTAPAGLNIRLYLKSEVRDFTLYRQTTTGNCRFPNFRLDSPLISAPIRSTAKPAR